MLRQITCRIQRCCERFVDASARNVTRDEVDEPAKDVMMPECPVARAGTTTPIAKDKTGDAVSLGSRWRD